MRYLCLIYQDESLWPSLPEAQADQVRREYVAFADQFRRSGHYLGGDPLHPTHTATTVRVRQGKLSATDGPFAETKEQLGGYIMIDADNLDQAIEIAGRIPSARHGSIEVRPVREFPRVTETA